MSSRRAVLTSFVTLLLISCFFLAFFTLEREWTPYLREPESPFSDQRTLYDEAAHAPSIPAEPDLPTTLSLNTSTSGSIVRQHIVVASSFPHHFDVFLAVVWSLERVLSSLPQSRVRVFAEPFDYGFQDIVVNLGLYSGQRQGSADFLPFLRSDNGRSVNLVVLGTCEIE